MSLPKKKTIIISVSAVLVAVVLGAIAWANMNKSNFNEETNKTTGASQSIDSDGTKHKEDGTTINATDTADGQQQSEVKPVITSYGQDGSVVRVRATSTQNGECRVIFTQSNLRVERTAGTNLVTSYYVCQGFDIDSSQFPAKGKWDVKVQFKSDTAQGESESKVLVIN